MCFLEILLSMTLKLQNYDAGNELLLCFGSQGSQADRLIIEESFELLLFVHS